MSEFIIELHSYPEYISNYIRKYNCWEPVTTEILLEIFRTYPNTIFIDIGANIGWFSLIAASKGIQTISFEPIKENYEVLSYSIEKNNYQDLIKVYKLALSDKRGSIVINIHKNNMGLCSIKNIKTVVDRKDICQTFRLDEVKLPNKNLVVKIDVNHMELEVLKGMKNIFPKVTHIILEISFYKKEIFNILRQYQFTNAVIITNDITTKTTFNNNSKHLSGGPWFATLNKVETYMQNTQNKHLFMFSRPNTGPSLHYSVPPEDN